MLRFKSIKTGAAPVAEFDLGVAGHRRRRRRESGFRGPGRRRGGGGEVRRSIPAPRRRLPSGKPTF